LKTLSLDSKQFLSITNPLLFSLTVDNRLRPLLPRLFHRFTNLTSLVLARNCRDIDQLLSEISCFPLNLTSLDISNQPTIPAIGLRAFSQNITTLTSLTCSHVKSINSSDLFLIAECFPLLEELDLSYPSNYKFKNRSNFLNGLETLSLALSKLTRINLSEHHDINDISLFHLFKNCKLLQKVIMFDCDGITKDGIFSALHERPTLRSLSFIDNKSRNFATLFALVKNYPSLGEIKLEFTYFTKSNIEKSYSSMDFVVSPNLKSLCLGHSLQLRDENIKMLASIFPNLELLDLKNCYDISKEGIFHILKRCHNIRHLNLSYTGVDDEALYILQLLLKACDHVTEKGVKHVVENCTQLREINLQNCGKVHGNIVDELVVSRPSLRKIEAPPAWDWSYKKKELFSRHGCVVHY